MYSTESEQEYSRYYGDFRGVDFSSDHTQVDDRRLAYLVNMYKDYQSGQGRAIETIPGFRRRVKLPENAPIYGIHDFTYKDQDGNNVTKVLVHAGERLYLWNDYPLPNCLDHNAYVTLPTSIACSSDGAIYAISTTKIDNPGDIASITKVEPAIVSQEGYTEENRPSVTHVNDTMLKNLGVIIVTCKNLYPGDGIKVTYLKAEMTQDNAKFSEMNPHRSTSFVFNNRLYLIDGKNYLVYDGNTVRDVRDVAYIPTTYINIIPSGTNADIGAEYEQKNFLQTRFKHTFIADGVTTKFFMNERKLDGITEVKLYGETVIKSEYEIDLDEGSITFTTAPPRPEDVVGYTENYAGIEITAEKTLVHFSGASGEISDARELITHCTVAAIYDDRVFLSGNPDFPNYVFFCSRNSGYSDPTYFGVLNYVQDGVGNTPITGMLPVADTLMVLKGDTRQDGTTYFHKPFQTGEDIKPITYPSTRGLSGIGCLGACINFLDDPVFISRLGVEAVGQLSTRLERAIEHRSSLIDAKLVNMDLKDAVLEEWNGYLLILVDGKIFMADSRQRYMHDTGAPQYEWFYLEDIGVYEGQYPEYRYASQMRPEFEGKTVKYCTECKKSAPDCECGSEDHLVDLPLALANEVYNVDLEETYNLLGEVANPPGEDGNSTVNVCEDIVEFGNESASDDTPLADQVFYIVHDVKNKVTGEIEQKALVCEKQYNKIGGVFKKATVLKVIEGNLFFGTENGVICSFNFDMRDDQGDISPIYYNFDDRTIFCGCATKMDCCNIPHLTKNTVKKSTVIKTKSFQTSAAKIKVRTNKKPYVQIARINSTMFSFDNMDFSDFSFITTEQSLFAVKEKEKKWVEKQYFLFSDEYQKPFALYYIAYRYTIAGRYKE